MTVTVIIPTYNRAHTIKETLDSVLAQTVSDVEVIVVDDGSTDNTEEVLKPYQGQIIYLKQENAGVSEARNYGYSFAKGEYISYLDSDDLWEPNFLKEQLKALNSNPEAAFVFCDTYIINENGKITDRKLKPKSGKLTFKGLYDRWYIYSNVVLIRRKYHDAIGGFDPVMVRSQCYDFWLRLAKGNQFVYNPQLLAKYRTHSGQISHDWELTIKCRLMIIEKPEIIKELKKYEVILRRAKVHFNFAQFYYGDKNYKKSLQHFIQAVCIWPLIGRYYWPQEGGYIRYNIIYRLLRPYGYILKCASHKMKARNHENTVSLS